MITVPCGYTGRGQTIDKRNYNHWFGPCFDLGNTIALWTNPSNYSPALAQQVGVMPFILTEDNNDMVNKPFCTSVAGCQGTYLVDLFTWLADNSLTNPATSPVRVAWFKGADSPGLPLGLYNVDGTVKPVTINYCPNVSSPVQGPSYISSDFYYLNDPIASCYEEFSSP